MLMPEHRSTGQTKKKRRLLPIVSVFLVACYLAVLTWYFTHGFKGVQEPDDTAAAPAVTEPAVSPYTPYPVTSDEPALPEQNADTEEFAAPAIKVKGLYIAAWYADNEERMAGYIDICDTTEINTLVIDVKDDLGQITYKTDTEGLSGTSVRIIPDIETLIATLKSHGVYTIARVVCFLDPVWSRLHPELAIKNTMGEPWKDGKGNTWLDPYNHGSWDYIAAVASDAARVGFDEVQLDYVRFPSDGNLGSIDYGSAGAAMAKTEAVSDFVSHIRAVLAEKGVRLSADVFGIIAISEVDSESIGQDMGLLLRSADCLSPMIYPSHFANKRQNGVGQIINGVLFEAPDLEPYGVVYNILLGTRDHLSADSGQAVIRPYLQYFTADYLGAGYYQQYTHEQVRQQIRAVYDAGFDEWIIWNHWSVYDAGAFEAAVAGERKFETANRA